MPWQAIPIRLRTLLPPEVYVPRPTFSDAAISLRIGNKTLKRNTPVNCRAQKQNEGSQHQ